ncbi:B-box zinc finger protein [Chloroflexota bacterium]
MRCTLHPENETGLACGKCGKPICPSCLVQTPVGARCRECAALKRLPVFQVSGSYYIRAIAAGFIAALVLGIIWPYIPLGGFLLLLLGAGIGYGIGEVVSLSVNRKRGSGLAAIAGASMLFSYTIRILFETSHLSFISQFFNVYGLVAMTIGIVIAIERLR